jgi:hypothetical protein
LNQPIEKVKQESKERVQQKIKAPELGKRTREVDVTK